MYEGMKIYIAGPITGTGDYKKRFEAAEKHLRDLGALPMHSAGLPQGFHHGEYLYICFAMIDVCDAIYFLEDWQDSPGAMREFEYAARKQKRLFYQGLDPAWEFDHAVYVQGVKSGRAEFTYEIDGHDKFVSFREKEEKQ